jgi:hypothetical protein
MRKVRNPSRRESGQSLAELALSLVVLLILLAGTVDIGRALFAFVQLKDAAEEGAIYGSIFPTDTNGVIQRTRGASRTPIDLTDTGTVSVAVSFIGNACEGNTVRVTVTYSMPLVMPFIGTFIGGQSVNVRGTHEARILRPPC